MSGNQRLAGAGGLIATPDQYGINGISYANGIGPSFALLISGVGAHAGVDVKPDVDAGTGEGARITATGDVNIKGLTYGNTESYAGATTGAFLGSLGFSGVRMNLQQNTLANVGAGSAIEAGGNIAVWAENQHTAFGTSFAGGGAAGVSVTGAKAVVEALPVTLANIGSGANLHAKGNIDISSRMGAKGAVKADSYAYAGLGSGGSAESFWSIGGAVNDFSSAPINTTVNLDANANIRADDNLNLYALVSDVDIATRTESSAASIFYSDPDAESRTLINSIALITAKAGAQAIGVNSFDAVARHNNVGMYTRAYAEGGSAFGAPDADAWGIQRNLSRIITDAGSAFGSKDLKVEASIYSPRNQVYQAAPGFSLAVWDDRGDVHPEYSFNRHITFNGDVILLSAPTPELLIDANGNIAVAEGVDAVDEGSRIVVNNLSNNGNAGKAVFDVAPMNVNGNPIFGTIDGNQGTVRVRHTWETVELTNLSSKDLWVNAIDPVDRTGRAKVAINADDNQYRFDIAHEFAPTVIDIANLGLGGAPAIVLNGLIDNPIGVTRVVNSRGDVLGSNTGKIRSNKTEIQAAGNIGQNPPLVLGSTSFGRLDLELVQSAGRTTDLNTQSGGYQSMRLRGLDRDPAGGLFELNLGTLQAGSDIDLLVLPTLEQLVVANAPAGYLVDVSEYQPTYDQVYGNSDPDTAPFGTTTTAYVDHYKPDGSGPDFVAPVNIFGTGNTPVDTHLRVGMLKAGGNINVVANYGSTRIDITANTNLTGLGRIDVFTNGNVILTETEGNLRAGTITSTQNDVVLTAAAGIVDAQGDAGADVLGNNITLTAQAGAIGSFLNDLELDTAYSAAGELTAHATSDVYIQEMTGSLVVNQAVATAGDLRLTSKDSAAAGEDIIVAAGKLVSALAGSVTLQSGDSLLLNGGVLALTNLFFNVDHRNADRGVGGNVNLRNATLAGSALRLRGDEDDDLLDADGVAIAS